MISIEGNEQEKIFKFKNNSTEVGNKLIFANVKPIIVYLEIEQSVFFVILRFY